MIEDGVLITGVGRRLGLHLAHTFLSRGLPVIGTFRTERASLTELADAGARLIYCDFYDENQLSLLVGEIQRQCASLRAVVHNASDWMPDDNELGEVETMRRMMAIHAVVPYRLNRALTPLLAASSVPHADIIHVGDYVSGRGSRKHTAYAASKAAQDNLTLSFAAGLGPRIKVNSVAPALIQFNEGDGAAYREKALSKNLLRKEGGLDEFQQAVDYLMGSQYVTGRILHLDGGRHLV